MTRATYSRYLRSLVEFWNDASWVIRRAWANRNK